MEMGDGSWVGRGCKFNYIYKLINVEINRMNWPRFQQSKTISTTPSVRELSAPVVHSYHRYETLLHYFTSFLTDFKLQILDLKQQVYQLVGLDLSACLATATADCLGGAYDCEHCEVEYMMKSCRMASQDIMRVLGLLRGYSSNKSQASKQPTKPVARIAIPASNTYFNNSQNVCPNTNYLKQCLPATTKNERPGYDDIGFLTFRENKENIDSNLVGQYVSSYQRKDEDAVLGGKRNMPTIHQEWEKSSIIDSESSGQDLDDCFEQAYNLIRLIRSEVNPQFEQEPTQSFHAPVGRMKMG